MSTLRLIPRGHLTQDKTMMRTGKVFLFAQERGGLDWLMPVFEEAQRRYA